MDNENSGKGKNFLIAILSLVVIGLVGFIFYDKVYTKDFSEPDKVQKNNDEVKKNINDKANEQITKLEGYYLLLFDASVVAIVLLAYKPVFHFIKSIWDISVLKSGKTYLYLFIGFIFIALSQYLMLHVFSFESAADQMNNYEG